VGGASPYVSTRAEEGLAWASVLSPESD
jgi:hypothetical protein